VFVSISQLREDNAVQAKMNANIPSKVPHKAIKRSQRFILNKSAILQILSLISEKFQSDFFDK